MKKIAVLIFLFISVCINASGGDTLSYKSKLVIDEIQLFIDTLKPRSIKNGYYNVYVVKFFADDKESKELCFTLGMINNAFELDEVHAEYYFNVGREFIVVNFNSINAKYFFEGVGLQRIDSSNRHSIIDKLISREEGGISGTSIGFVSCFNKNGVERLVYDNSDYIPQNASIYDFNIEDIKIELIYDPKMGPIDSITR